MIIFENKAVKVHYDQSVPCVVWAPLQFMKGDEWRDRFIKGVDFLRQKIKTTHNVAWLNDTRLLKTVRQRT
ncbi:MAG: hypothetical protein HC896_04200 [Bacteroidales bacterium]|nr:hypothetical protein [Bacteroidales bacterium]